METTEITLHNVNWYDRNEAVEAFEWYGFLTNAERQAYVSDLNRADVELLGQMILATATFMQLTGNRDFDLTVLRDLTERLFFHSLRNGW